MRVQQLHSRGANIVSAIVFVIGKRLANDEKIDWNLVLYQRFDHGVRLPGAVLARKKQYNILQI